jgi:hypothetical protein
MSIVYRTKRPDPVLRRIGESLTRYADAHPGAKIELYRQNNVSVRIRILDQDFGGKSLVERETEVWPLFDELPEEVVADVTMLLLLTPEEREQSLGSFEFEHLTKSRI